MMPFMYMYLKLGFIELSSFHRFILRNYTRLVEEKTPFSVPEGPMRKTNSKR